MTSAETVAFAVQLIVKAAVLAARWAGHVRCRVLQCHPPDAESSEKELLFLQARVEELESEARVLRALLKKTNNRRRYTLKQRLQVIFHLELFQIPRRQVKKYFGISRSTLYRWLRRVDQVPRCGDEPRNKTPADIAALVWEIARTNVNWGRIRIANQLALLNIFIAASTVSRILNRPRPRNPAAVVSQASGDAGGREPGSIPAWYPNHVWSVDLTTVKRWGLWPTFVVVAIDHFSRRVVAARPLDGPNAGWVADELEAAFEKLGQPKHIITDRGSVFTGRTFRELLNRWNVKHRLGAVGQHGSIAVTERVIETLKYEWLRPVPLVKGFDHLERLCAGFADWYNNWRPHMSLDGQRPGDIYTGRQVEKPERTAKVIPLDIERRVFAEQRLTGYRLKKAA